MDNSLFTTEPFLTGKPLEVWLASMGVKGWSVNKDGSVDVAGTVHLGEKLGPLTKLPVRFGKVGGNFNCYQNQLVSLEGAPKEVGGWFYCTHNQLLSLEGVPPKIAGDFWCDHNQLVTLEGAPKLVGGDFTCNNNQLVSLEGAPKEVRGNFWCDHNLLVDFKGMEGVCLKRKLIVTHLSGTSQDNAIVSLNGLPKELYSSVRGLDMQVVLELDKKRAANLMGSKEAEDLISELELG